MDQSRSTTSVQGSFCNWLMLFTIWICSFQDIMSQQTAHIIDSHIPFKFELPQPPTALFDPIEISPAVMPHNPFPGEPLPPMYPSFPSTYEPVLTGRCPINFSDISSIIDKTASDCSAPLAALVGNVICCPQVTSLMHIFQGAYSNFSDRLVLQPAAAEDCFSDIISMLASRGANNSIPGLCTMNSRNLTGGSCPVKDATTFEKKVNTSKLLDSCSTVDPLKECCRPSCQPAVMDAALQISFGESSLLGGSNLAGNAMGTNVLSDCKGVVYAWLSRKLSLEAANTAFRMLSSCKVNKVFGPGLGSMLGSLKCMLIRLYGIGLEVYAEAHILSDRANLNRKQVVEAATWWHSIVRRSFINSATCLRLSWKFYKKSDIALGRSANEIMCPLTFKEPSSVIKACRDLASPNPSCCSSLNTYVADLQKQMLITNRQAINCAMLFGSMLQKGGVMTNVYELCDVDLKDFSLQAATYGQQGCLLRSWPVDIIYDNYTGFSFTCDLNDNIAAPWPSSSLSSLSLCAPEMSLPALPVPQTSGTSGSRETGMGFLLLMLSALYYKYTVMG